GSGGGGIDQTRGGWAGEMNGSAVTRSRNVPEPNAIASSPANAAAAAPARAARLRRNVVAVASASDRIAAAGHARAAWCRRTALNPGEGSAIHASPAQTPSAPTRDQLPPDTLAGR